MLLLIADKLDGEQGSHYLDYSNFVGVATDADKLDGEQGSHYLDYSNFVGVATDADKLDGEQGTYYLNYNNLSNTPTIPTNNDQLTNGAGFITTSFTNTNQLTNGAGFITTSFTNTNQLTNGAGFITNNVTGTITATSFSGTATTATNLSDGANITNGTISDARLPDLITSNINASSGVSTVSELKVGTAITMSAGIVTATTFSGSGTNLTGLTGASAATYGDASNVAQIVVDSNGRITGISNVTISGGDTVSITTTAADILSVSSGAISADDAGADKIVFWDDSEGKLTYLTVGTNLSISGTTISASGGGGGVTTGKAIAMAMVFG